MRGDCSTRAPARSHREETQSAHVLQLQKDTRDLQMGERTPHLDEKAGFRVLIAQTSTSQEQ